MVNPEKEVMCAAFTEKLAQEKLGLDFTAIQSNEEFENVKASIDGWEALSGPERRERATITITIKLLLLQLDANNETALRQPSRPRRKLKLSHA